MTGKRHLRGQHALGCLPPAPGLCPLCGRPLVPGPSVDEHHLLPRSHGGKQAEAIHRICHRKVHATLTEKELATRYNHWAALRAHEGIAAFVAWIQKKPPEYYDNSRKSASKGLRKL
jgi:5-methylcytosine-specific restriction endonuclease McrA